MVSNIVSFFASLILLFAGLFVLTNSYFKETDAHFKFRNTFPYELHYLKINTFNIIGRILICLSFLSLGVFYIIYPIDRKFLGSIEVISSFISVFGVLAILSALMVSILNMKNVKYHLMGTTFLLSFCVILTTAIAIMGFWTLKNPHETGNIDIKKIICSSVAILELIALCALLFNKKLRNWAKLEEKSNEDGSKIYLRPKWFALAYSEWAFISSIYFNGLLLFIMFI